MNANLAEIPRARWFATTVARYWGFDDLVPELTLLASETLTNAIEHGAAPICLRLTLVDDGIRVTVDDAGRGLPVDAGFPEPGAESGRGVAIVRALASNFGMELVPQHGKAVWFDLRRSA